ncbi:MAG: CoA-binding protein [Kiritimatiellae bacterium]|nr:CoA-binding protein [Kiritimatiellia bacterium]
MKQRVVVVGASPKPERYANRAIRLLLEHGHDVIPVHPAVDSIEGVAVMPRLSGITGPVDTVTLYVSAAISTTMEEALIKLQPGRVIFNPGAENPGLQAALAANGIDTEDACTLVLLHSNQFSPDIL